MNKWNTEIGASQDYRQELISATDTAASAPDQTPPSGVLSKTGDVARVMLYLHPKVARKFKEMGFIENRKAHDVYLEALDLYLTRQGHGGLKGVIER